MIPQRPKLHIFVKGATHFLSWETVEWQKYFNLVPEPGPEVALLCFGPDALDDAVSTPASKRFAVLFPGFGFNPLYNPALRKHQRSLIDKHFSAVFINPGALEVAYKGLKNVYF